LTSALDEGEWLASCPGRFYPRGNSTVYEAEWALEPLRALAPVGNRTLAIHSVAIPTELS
jgi:hypothetical protein